MIRPPKDLFFVSVQVLLLGLFLFCIPDINFEIPMWLRWAGMAVFVTGVAVIVAGFVTLEKNLSAFPTPKRSSRLVQSGIYKSIRHPIYTGILFMASGLAFYSECTWRFIVFLSLLILFRFKAAYEEKLLTQRFSGYTEYKKTSGMFLPRF